MYPVLFKIPLFGGITIHTYGVLVATGFVLGISWAVHESKRLGQDPAKMLDLVFYLLIAAIVGSRVFHVFISQRTEFFQNPLILFQVWRGGLVFYGGLICCLLVAVWFIRRHKMKLLITLDIFAPAISIGHAVGRIGCLMAGCCYGREASHGAWYSLTFPGVVDSFAPGGTPLFPTQLMEVTGELIILSILMIVRRFKRFDGQLMATYLMLYAVLRYFNEFFRGDFERGFVIDPWLSTSQSLSILLFAVGLFMYIKLWKRGCEVK
ncbi:MAG: prolipoprotein diacylglyceryl transferase [Deltaproteobacteria bacterium]|jgi:phosphatidylglycerol---prolipoprotein diacylglyceryl transferase|nr:prolipoprotein diacylglyceryl transferase [Deltaproteobacteria bacterium]